MTTGAKSSIQLTRLAAKYNEIQSNGRILSNRNAMEIIWTRVQQLAERIDLNDAPERMETIKDLWTSFRSLSSIGLEAEANVTARKIDAEFEKAYHDYMAWRQMFQALELHSKMTESEVKIMKDLRAIITAEQAYELTARLLGEIISAVNGTPMDSEVKAKVLKRIQYGFTRVIGEGYTGKNPNIVDADAESEDE